MSNAARSTLSRVALTNQICSDEEIKAISVALSEAEMASERLRKTGLSRKLRPEDKTKLKKLTKDISRYKFALAPHKKLPLEVLQPIFQLCALDAPLDTYVEPMNKLPAIALMGVCSAWRHIVLDTPILWSVVRTSISDRGIRLARRWLSRAGNVPRSLTIAGGRSALKEDPMSLFQFPYRKLSITLEEGFRIPEIPMEFLSPLEELSVRCNDWDGFKSLLTGHGTPRLQVLQIRGTVNVTSLKQIFEFPEWQMLRELYLSRPIPEADCLTILSQLTGIVTCSLYVSAYGARAGEWEKIPVLYLSKLELSLERRGRHNPETISIVDHLITPRLRSLSILVPERCALFCNIQTLRQFSQRSDFILEEFKTPKTSPPLRVGEMLDWMPSLQSLVLNDFDAVLDRDTIRAIADGRIGTQLRELAVKSPQSVHEMLTMVETRRTIAEHQSAVIDAPISYLTKVSFTKDTPKSPEEARENYQQRITQLKRDGIIVVVRTGYEL